MKFCPWWSGEACSVTSSLQTSTMSGLNRGNKITSLMFSLSYLYILSGIIWYFSQQLQHYKISLSEHSGANKAGTILHLCFIRYFLHSISQLTSHQVRSLCNSSVTLLLSATYSWVSNLTNRTGQKCSKWGLYSSKCKSSRDQNFLEIWPTLPTSHMSTAFKTAY